MTTKIKMTHTFNAPRDLVFKAFTESEHLLNWWGPKGWAFDIKKFDLRPGGLFHYKQTAPDGTEMWVKFIYHEVNSPEKIVYTNSFSDEKGNTVRAPFDANWPLEFSVTFIFSEDGDKTILTMEGAAVSPTEEEAKTLEASQDMVHEGYKVTFNQLADYLLMV
ncbi:polyketide cyclase [Paenibacillus sp. FSL A5-0031]|uniref:SRPBCC family protein n=1 Tax=Paenibacillus sp. FSL A5-0031 TaxID=1920420 RepID=UPI00096F82FF|nr:SRPBCC domain-containing protein [Paenibacillus sp. FSL A5-0031]OME88346.1 polyketide cyclase [Paenibacillus sp. FSL A5-0031]